MDFVSKEYFPPFCDMENDPIFKSSDIQIQKQLDYFRNKLRNIYNKTPFNSKHHIPKNGTPCCFDMYVPNNCPVIFYSYDIDCKKFSCFSCGKKYSKREIQNNFKKVKELENKSQGKNEDRTSSSRKTH